MDADKKTDKKTKPKRRTTSRAVTMEAVGRLAGVSQVTVSRALSNPSLVSDKTLQKIHDAVKATGFLPNALAGALASNRSGLISALVPSIDNIVYSTMIQSFTAGIRESGYQIMLSETGLDPDEEERLIATHLSRRPDAMLLTGIHHTQQARRMLLGADIPVAEVWDLTDSPIDFCVGFSHSQTGQVSADFAFDTGYRASGAIAAGDERARRRMNAFNDRFLQRGGQVLPAATFETSASLAMGREGLTRLIDKEGFKQGVVFCSSDVVAHGVMVEARARKLDIPGQVAVIGFGDQDFASHVEPELTTVRVDRKAFGTAAAQKLLERFQDVDRGSAVVDLGFEIIRRDSA